MRSRGEAGNLEQIKANSTVLYFEACVVACDSFWFLFLSVTLCRSFVLNTMPLLIKNEMIGVVLRKKKSAEGFKADHCKPNVAIICS